MSADSNKAVKPDKSQNTKQTVDTSRRSFAKAGVVAPMIMTLVSRPAMASTLCFTPSRSLSRNTSVSQQGNDGMCEGKSPGYYKNHLNWPGGVKPKDPFLQYFNNGAHSTVDLSSNPTLLKVLNLEGNQDSAKLAFHIIAAYLNCLAHLVPSNVLSATDVQNIWNEYVQTGYYTVTAGVTWDATQIVTYLTTFEIAP